MRNLINFIVKNIHWWFFLLLVIVPAFLIIKNNEFQRSKYLILENELIGKSYIVSDYINSYIALRTTNQDLINKVVEQETLIRNLEERLSELSLRMKTPSFINDSLAENPYEFIPARVVYNNVSGVDNLMTLNKGINHGVRVDMGVFSLNGIVGRVINVTPNFSVVIPLLNPKFRPSCKVLGDNSFGPLVWNERDPRYADLEELPRHVNFQVGDTIVTSGFSVVFPEGIPVGVIVGSKKQRDDNFNSLKVKLFTDFSKLREVFIVKKTNREEQIELEQISESYVK